MNPPVKPQDHHVIPAFRGKRWSTYEFLHGKGQWNQKWMNFIDNNPNATAKDIYQFAGKMMDDYGLSAYPMHPYGK